MCGIVGYVGNEQAAPILLNGLAKLEYRGYDSAGIAVRDGDKHVEVVKAKGRLKALEEKTNNGLAIKGTCGIGHTRWATHGEPSENNAHPHISDDYNVVGVHNGIIENYQELKDKLVKNGYEFYSSTDTEVAIKLIDYYYKKYEHTPVDAINHAMVRIRGSYAFAIMFKEYPDEIYVARKDSPMILGVSDGNCYVGSDVPAILNYTRNVYYIGNMEIARVRKGEITFYNLDGDEIEKELKTIDWNAEAAEKAGYEHFMMKEIHEQPKVVGDTINSVVKEDFIDLLALTQSVPGIFAVNIAIFIGYKLRKFRGALAMALGTILPSFFIILAIALFFQQFKQYPIVENIFKGIRPAVVALIAAPTFSMAKSAKINRYTVWIPIVSALLIWVLDVSPVYIIIIAGVGGFIYGKYKHKYSSK